MFRAIRRSRERKQIVEQHEDASLEDAERRLRDLQERGSRAIQTLNERHRRNHWREAIQEMIQGV